MFNKGVSSKIRCGWCGWRTSEAGVGVHVACTHDTHRDRAAGDVSHMEKGAPPSDRHVTGCQSSAWRGGV